MHRTRSLLRLAALVLLVPGCSATHVVRPLPRGVSQWSASVGGPWLPEGMPTKLTPYVTLGAQHGLTDALTLGGAVHATLVAYGVAAGEVSATRRLATGAGLRPDVAVMGHLYLFAGTGGSRAFPAIGGLASWQAGERTLLFGGAQLLGQFTGTPAVVATPLAGVQRRIRSRIGVQAEAKWMAVNVDTRAGVFEGESSIGGRGALGLQLGFTIDRGKRP